MLNASDSKKLTALRAKANLTANEQEQLEVLEAKLQDSNVNKDVVNPPATAKIVGVAEIKLRDDNAEKPVLIRLTDMIGDTEVLLLSAKQADALAASINIFDKGVDAWRRMKTTVGNRRSELELSVQVQKKGSIYVDRNGVVVVRDTDGYSVLPQMFILPQAIQAEMDSAAVKSIVHTWTSSARFLPKAQPAETGAEE